MIGKIVALFKHRGILSAGVFVIGVVIGAALVTQGSQFEDLLQLAQEYAKCQ